MSTTAGTLVLGALVGNPYADFASQGPLAAAFASIGVSLVTLSQGGVSWAFIGRKGSARATSLSSSGYLQGGVIAQSLFRCYNQQLRVPENAGSDTALVMPVMASTTYQASTTDVVLSSVFAAV